MHSFVYSRLWTVSFLTEFRSNRVSTLILLVKKKYIYIDKIKKDNIYISNMSKVGIKAQNTNRYMNVKHPILSMTA